MRPYAFAATCFAVAITAGMAAAQTQNPAARTSAGAVQTTAAAEGLANLPEACRTAAQGTPMGQMMQGMPMMQGTMPPLQNMPMMANLPPANADYMEAMRTMNPAMMHGMAIGDPELAFLCAMVPHHQGAIDMAEAVLKHAKDAEVRKNAEKTIADQKKDIEELTRLIEKRGK